MPQYNKLYTFLFGRVTDAIEALETKDTEKAKEILLAASLEAEELYLTSDPEDGEYPAEPMTEELFEAIMELLREKGDFTLVDAFQHQYPQLAERYEETILEA